MAEEGSVMMKGSREKMKKGVNPKKLSDMRSREKILTEKEELFRVFFSESVFS